MELWELNYAVSEMEKKKNLLIGLKYRSVRKFSNIGWKAVQDQNLWEESYNKPSFLPSQFLDDGAKRENPSRAWQSNWNQKTENKVHIEWRGCNLWSKAQEEEGAAEEITPEIHIWIPLNANGTECLSVHRWTKAPPDLGKNLTISYPVLRTYTSSSKPQWRDNVEHPRHSTETIS